MPAPGADIASRDAEASPGESALDSYPAAMAGDDISWIAGLIREIRDYPRPGVTFRDITPLLGDAEGFVKTINALVSLFEDQAVDRVIGIEARGFIVGAPVAYRIGAGFVPARKAGKLPWAVAREEYQLEYGSDKLEIHRDALHPGERVLIIDDVLATGGTAQAAAKLVEVLGGELVGLGFVIEIAGLNGRLKLGDRVVHSLITF